MSKPQLIKGRVNALVSKSNRLPKTGRTSATTSPPVTRRKQWSAAEVAVRPPGESGNLGRRSEPGLAALAVRQRASVVPQRVFYPDGAGWWHVGFAGRVKPYRDTLGFRQIYQLLRRPGQVVSVFELSAKGLGAYQELTPEPLTNLRKNVCSTISYTLEKLVRQDPRFGAHLRDCIKLGRWYGYFPNVHAEWFL